MEGLLKENEELRNKNQILESQLKTVLDPCTVTASRREDRGLDPGVVEEWSNKLRAATDGYRRIKLDVEKLKGVFYSRLCSLYVELTCAKHGNNRWNGSLCKLIL